MVQDSASTQKDTVLESKEVVDQHCHASTLKINSVSALVCPEAVIVRSAVQLIVTKHTVLNAPNF